MPFEVGHSHASKKRRLFADQLKRTLVQDPSRLTRICNKLLEEAEAGQSWAMALLLERIDGKVPTPLALDDMPEGAELQWSVRVVAQEPKDITPVIEHEPARAIESDDE